MSARLEALRRVVVCASAAAFGLAAAGAAAAGCSAAPSYVTTPMSAAVASPDASADEGADGGGARVVFRPLPPEPTPPSPRARCRREVSCEPEETVAPSVWFPPPFERCRADNGDGARFSPRETRDARRGDSHACCYVAFADCRG